MTLHISSAYNEDLIYINSKIVEMGGLCEQIMNNTNLSIRDNNVQLAEKAVLLDEKLDFLENEINESVIKAIALRQPVADDLRVLFSAIKISGAFERVGDLCKNIAKRTQLLTDEYQIDIRRQIFELGEKVKKQLTRSINSYTNQDIKLATKVWINDYKIDQMYTDLFENLLVYLKKKKRVASGSHLMIIAKNYERIGDHTTHIGEMTHFAITGENLVAIRPKVNLPV